MPTLSASQKDWSCPPSSQFSRLYHKKNAHEEEQSTLNIQYKKQYYMDMLLRDKISSNISISDPTENDVLLGRTRRAFTCKGNVKLREQIAAKLDMYNEAPTRKAKTLVIRSVMQMVFNSGGRFLKLDPHTNLWCEANMTEARRKVGHAFRDACKPGESNSTMN